MQYNKLWDITSYEDYVNKWPLGSRLKSLTTYMQKIGYKTGEEFFNKNAYLAQEMANQKVGGIIDRIFNTKQLPENTQKYLIHFTYLAIDFLIMNDMEINETVRTNQTSLNNGRTDSSTTTLSSVEQLVGTMAWRAFNMSSIQTLYRSYCENEGIPFLLDPALFYDKNEIDTLIAEQDNYIIKMKDIIKEDIKKDEEFRNIIATMVGDNKELKDYLFNRLGTDKDFQDKVAIILANNDAFKNTLMTLISNNKDFQKAIEELMAKNTKVLDAIKELAISNKDFQTEVAKEISLIDSFNENVGNITYKKLRADEDFVNRAGLTEEQKKDLETLNNNVADIATIKDKANKTELIPLKEKIGDHQIQVDNLWTSVKDIQSKKTYEFVKSVTLKTGENKSLDLDFNTIYYVGVHFPSFFGREMAGSFNIVGKNGSFAEISTVTDTLNNKAGYARGVRIHQGWAEYTKSDVNKPQLDSDTCELHIFKLN
ncbi:hypothetical protein MENTO_v1c04740 [Mesoplasma entomophilum]|uniref:Uncharacterized protein n=1 Tax=Mesoplasma entomophilum TaxID=2149 RepID=A0A3S5Y0D3_9MOLU|nr:hypothetical protein [Mesoplasma entomophilum]ATQ35610.1 hypothetical protein CS528_02455 [Mesoplasma entomophilum]ATZ19579.1 hypothetical protein MENTO_v1c04740 [Mesoplasma entomophilum]